MTTSSVQTLTMSRIDMLAEDSEIKNSIEDSEPKLRQSCDSSLERTTMPLHSETSSKSIHSSQSLVTASFLERPISPPIIAKSIQLATRTRLKSPSGCLLLDYIPKEVLARDILGFLSDNGVKTFFETLGEERLKSSSFSELRNQFCLRHGSKLEDQESFVTSDGEETNQKHSVCQIIRKPGSKRRRCCPECHAEQQEAKRCHGCKVFYRNSDNKSTNNKAFPGLSCQKCDRMAYCRSCLSNESQDRHGSTFLATALSASHGRKHRLYNHQSTKGSSSCHNYCCPSDFTNTMCGEFVCLDCTDDNQKMLRLANDSDAYDSSAIEICEDCGKSTCLDPHCLVCADFKLIHMVCKFSPEDAYRLDIGGLLFGSKTNGSNLNLSTKLRRNLSDGMVWILVLMMLSKMWWFKKKQELGQEL